MGPNGNDKQSDINMETFVMYVNYSEIMAEIQKEIDYYRDLGSMGILDGLYMAKEIIEGAEAVLYDDFGNQVDNLDLENL